MFTCETYRCRGPFLDSRFYWVRISMGNASFCKLNLLKTLQVTLIGARVERVTGKYKCKWMFPHMDYNCAYCLEVCFPPQTGLKINVPQFPMWGCHILCFPGAVSKGLCLAVMTFTSRGFRGAKGVAEAACLSVWLQSSSDINSSVQRTLLDASLLVGGLYENRNPWL